MIIAAMKRARPKSTPMIMHTTSVIFLLSSKLAYQLYQKAAVSGNQVYPIDAEWEPSRKIGTSK